MLGVTPERRVEFRVAVHLGDVLEESDGNLIGDGVNIAARSDGIAGLTEAMFRDRPKYGYNSIK